MRPVPRSALANALACSSACSLVSRSGRKRRLLAGEQVRPQASGQYVIEVKVPGGLPSANQLPVCGTASCLMRLGIKIDPATGKHVAAGA